MKIQQLEKLIARYGKQAKLIDVLNDVRGNRIYKCPKCEGTGVLVEKFNDYPRGLPDSDYTYKEGRRECSCDLCDGHGYTSKEFKPKFRTELIGYEKVED